MTSTRRGPDLAVVLVHAVARLAPTTPGALAAEAASLALTFRPSMYVTAFLPTGVEFNFCVMKENNLGVTKLYIEPECYQQLNLINRCRNIPRCHVARPLIFPRCHATRTPIDRVYNYVPAVVCPHRQTE